MGNQKWHRVIPDDDPPLPDPDDLVFRWTALGVPPAVIEKHVAALQRAPTRNRDDVAKLEREDERRLVTQRWLRKPRGPYIDLTGKRFGSLRVLAVHDRRPGKHYRWKCQCDCGQHLVVFGTNLKKQHTTRCNDCADKVRAAQRRKVTIAAVKELLQAGWSQAAIAAKFKVTQAAISWNANKLGLGGRAAVRVKA